MSGDPEMMLLHSWIEEHLIELEKLFPKHYELTFIARNTQNTDADVIVTKDKMESVINSIHSTWGHIAPWQGDKSNQS